MCLGDLDRIEMVLSFPIMLDNVESCDEKIED